MPAALQPDVPEEPVQVFQFEFLRHLQVHPVARVVAVFDRDVEAPYCSLTEVVTSHHLWNTSLSAACAEVSTHPDPAVSILAQQAYSC